MRTGFCFTVWKLKETFKKSTSEKNPSSAACVCTDSLGFMLGSRMSLDTHTNMTFWYKNNIAAFPSLFSGCPTGTGPYTLPGFLCCCQPVAETLGQSFQCSSLFPRGRDTKSLHPVEILPVSIWFYLKITYSD